MAVIQAQALISLQVINVSMISENRALYVCVEMIQGIWVEFGCLLNVRCGVRG